MSESDIPSHMRFLTLKSPMGTDNVQRLKRRRQFLSFARTPGNLSHTEEAFALLPNLAMPRSRVTEVTREGSCFGGEIVIPPQSELLKDSVRVGTRCNPNIRSGSNVLFDSEPQALMEDVGLDNIQKVKRQKFTKVVETGLEEVVKELFDQDIPDIVALQGLVCSEARLCREESLANPKFDGVRFARPISAQGGVRGAAEIMIPRQRDSQGKTLSERKDGGLCSARSSSSESLAHFAIATSDTCRFSRHSGGSSQFHFGREKEWWGGHCGGEVAAGIVHGGGFAAEVGACYRSLIGKRPAARHPGFVGDGDSGQYCRICGDREDALNALICDSCEEVFHMTCTNVRMEIACRVDEWLCRSCQQKRKMTKECEIQGVSDSGRDFRDRWRQDSGIGRADQELVRMRSGRRLKVRIGSKYQADTPEWTGIVDEVYVDGTLTSGPKDGCLLLSFRQVPEKSGSNAPVYYLIRGKFALMAHGPRRTSSVGSGDGLLQTDLQMVNGNVHVHSSGIPGMPIVQSPRNCLQMRSLSA